MNANAFDKLLIDKINEQELEYRPSHWLDMAALLSASDKLATAGYARPVGTHQLFDGLLVKKIDDGFMPYRPEHWAVLALHLPATATNKDLHRSGTEKFDYLLAQKFASADQDFAYKPNSWSALAEKLPAVRQPQPMAATIAAKNTRSIWQLAAGIAAAVLLLLIGSLYWLQNSPTQETVTNDIVQGNTDNAPKTKTNTAPENIPHEEAVAAQQTAPFDDRKEEDTHNAAARPNNATQIPGTHAQLTPDNRLPTNELAGNNPAPPPQHNVAQEPTKQNVLEREDALRRLQEIREGKANQQQNFNQHFASNGVKHPGTTVALGGGVNYGSLNTGYSAGITVRRKIAGDFFVDGTVAMMYNNNASNIVANNGPSVASARPAGAAARGTAFSSVASPAIDPVQRLYYVQVNPSIGYRVQNTVNVSMGADMQRMLTGAPELVQPETNSALLLPSVDLGVTAKTDLSITPNVQAGIMYREGVNNLLRKNENVRYLNRRYVQVQFKYSIPLSK
ncbi:MAG: hypothetical protein QM642_08730 [Edaphocola sp.]